MGFDVCSCQLDYYGTSAGSHDPTSDKTFIVSGSLVSVAPGTNDIAMANCPSGDFATGGGDGSGGVLQVTAVPHTSASTFRWKPDGMGSQV